MHAAELTERAAAVGELTEQADDGACDVAAVPELQMLDAVRNATDFHSRIR